MFKYSVAIVLLVLALVGCAGNDQAGSAGPPTGGAALAVGPQMEGEVFDAATSSEVSEAQVTLNGMVATSDREGVVRFPQLAPGTYPITTSKAGFSGYSGTVTLAAGDTDLGIVPLFPPGFAGDVAGNVTEGPGGAPLAGALVTLGETSVVTDASGGYRFEHVPPTLHDVTVGKAGYNESSATFTVVADASLTLNFTMYPAGSRGQVLGTVKDPQTITVIGGVQVSAGNQKATSLDDGSYTLADIPAGTQQLTATKNGYNPQTLNVVVTPQGALTQNLALTLASRLVRKPPYLLLTGQEGQMGVTWQTFDTPSTCTIEWGRTPQVRDGSASVSENSPEKDEHLFLYTLSNLRPGERVYYRVRIETRTFEGSFATPPPRSASRVTFYGYGDTRTQPFEHDRVLQAVLQDMDRGDWPERHTFLLHGGDFVSRGLMENYWDNEFFNPDTVHVQRLLAEVPVLGTLGNHECYKDVPGKGLIFDHKNGGKLYRKYWPYPDYPRSDRFYHSYEYGPVHIAILDAYMFPTLAPGEEQNQWLDQDLAGTDRPWKIVVIHQPIYASTVYSASLDKNLAGLLEHHGVKLVVQSHAHYYSRVEVKPEGIQYVTIGGGGAEVSPVTPYNAVCAQYPIVAAQDYNFARFEADESELRVTALTPNGARLDEFRIHRKP